MDSTFKKIVRTILLTPLYSLPWIIIAILPFWAILQYESYLPEWLNFPIGIAALGLSCVLAIHALINIFIIGVGLYTQGTKAPIWAAAYADSLKKIPFFILYALIGAFILSETMDAAFYLMEDMDDTVGYLIMLVTISIYLSEIFQVYGRNETINDGYEHSMNRQPLKRRQYIMLSILESIFWLVLWIVIMLLIVWVMEEYVPDFDYFDLVMLAILGFTALGLRLLARYAEKRLFKDRFIIWDSDY